jgi:uncharacterized membrane protein YccC
MTILGRILYVLLGSLLALLLYSILLPSSQQFTALDLWRFFVSPAIISLIAASIGARAGARSNVKATEEDLAKTYASLLDLAGQDIRINLDIMKQVRNRIDAI